MGESKHTQEPWVFGRTGEEQRMILGAGASERYVCNVRIHQTPRAFGLACESEREANARRIVAAVNATAGIPTEALEAGAIAEMVAALKLARPYMEASFNEEDGAEFAETKNDLARIDAALAKIGGA